MSEEEKKEENKPEVIKIGDEEVSKEELERYWSNRKKFEADYHQKGELAHQLQQKVQELEQKLQAKGETPKAEKKSQKLADLVDSSDEGEFLSALINRVDELTDQLHKVHSEFDQVKSSVFEDTKETTTRKNLELIQKFQQEHGLKDDEIPTLAKLAVTSYHNVPRAGGIIELSPRALEDALLLMRKDEIERKSANDGKAELLKQLLGKEPQKPTSKSGKPDEPDLKWLADNWHKLSDEEAEKYRKLLAKKATG